MRSRVKMLAVLISLLLRPGSVGAHRLDEYLQATLIGIDANRVSLEVDLTPGVSIAKQVTGWIDTNADGQLSQAEGLAYAHEVLSSVVLTVDQRSVALTMRDVQLPAVNEMAAGVGTIRLRASAELPTATNGRHELTLVNTHRPQTSIYLANALVPADGRIQILTQQRDRDQHSLTIGYDLETMGGRRRISWVIGAVALLGMTAAIRGGFGRLRTRQTSPV